MSRLLILIMINLVQKTKIGLVLFLFILNFILYVRDVNASPWLETDDVYLRSDLQLLADAGVVTVPVNTFPLPWREISQQIKNSTPTELDENVRQAYYHILFKINASKNGHGNRSLKLKTSSENMPSSFGTNNDVLWGVFSNVEIVETRFAMRISASYAQYHDKQNTKFDLDNSYFAVTTGKTNFFISTLPQWWSPSSLQSISAERRVHPAYELGLERTFMALPLLGDIYFKTSANQLRSSDDWKYSWRSRLSLRPANALEVSFSYFDFKEVQNTNTKDDYQQLSMDGRLSLLSIIDLPLAVYGQKIIDDSQEDYSDALIGSDYSLFAGGLQMRFVFEYRNAEGHTINTHLDKKRYSVGSYVQMKNDHQWQLFLHHEKSDNDENQLVGVYRFLFYKGMLSSSLLLSDTQDDSDKINASLTWELRF